MVKQIWLPDSTTHVITEPDGTVKVWDSMVMTRKDLEEKKFGFNNKEKEDDEKL